MGGSSNSSFIPKRGPSNRPKKAVAKQVYVFTLVSYVLFFAVLTASVAVFFYNNYVTNQLENEVVSLNNAIGEFSQTELTEVKEFDLRLQKAKERLENSVSFTAIFSALESDTLETVQIDDLKIERFSDAGFEINVSMVTNNFDSSILQRRLLSSNSIIETVEVSEVTIQPADQEDDLNQVDLSQVNLNILIGVPLEAIPYSAAPQPAPVPELIDPSQNIPSASSTEAEIDEEEAEVINQGEI